MSAPTPAKSWWRQRLWWTRIGYTLSALWIACVLIWTDSDPNHPLFDWIFVVPLAAWIAGLAIGHVIARRLPPEDPGASR